MTLNRSTFSNIYRRDIVTYHKSTSSDFRSLSDVKDGWARKLAISWSQLRMMTFVWRFESWTFAAHVMTIIWSTDTWTSRRPSDKNVSKNSETTSTNEMSLPIIFKQQQPAHANPTSFSSMSTVFLTSLWLLSTLTMVQSRANVMFKIPANF